MSINYVPFHIGDFLSGTMHMDATEIGAYMMLLLAHYQIGVEGIPSDDKTLARISKLTMKQWLRVKDTVLEKFTLSGSKYVSSKCVEVISQINSKSTDQRAKALKRWKTEDAAALQMQYQPKTNNQKPNRSSNEDKRERVIRPESVSQETWDDFLKIRKAKRLPLTHTAWKGILREAEGIGWDIGRVITTCCEKGWGSFEAEWVRKNGKPDRKSKLANDTTELLERIAAGGTGQNPRNHH